MKRLTTLRKDALTTIYDSSQALLGDCRRNFSIIIINEAEDIADEVLTSAFMTLYSSAQSFEILYESYRFAEEFADELESEVN